MAVRCNCFSSANFNVDVASPSSTLQKLFSYIYDLFLFLVTLSEFDFMTFEISFQFKRIHELKNKQVVVQTINVLPTFVIKLIRRIKLKVRNKIEISCPTLLVHECVHGRGNVQILHYWWLLL